MEKRRNIFYYQFMSLILVCTMIFSLFGNVTKVEAATKYYIQVNKNTNVVTVYKRKVNGVYKDPVKAFICSTGYATPLGTFNTKAKYRWHTLDGPSYGQYCTRIVGGILFHSVWYYENGKNNTISVAQYNKLGTTASHGCVRMTVQDVKWIYDNCAIGTEVKIIAGTSKNDPLGKPEALKLNTSKKTDWCPTDPDTRNPYKNKKPTIKGAKNQTINLGATFNPLSGVTATDTAGNSATSKITVSGTVNTKKAGKYKITYKVTDAIGRTAQKTVTITVKDTTNVVISAKNQTIQLGAQFEPLKNVTAKTKAGTNRTSTITYSGKVNTKKVGSYKITYTAKDVLGRSAKKTVTITVKDTSSVVISAEDQKVQLGATFEPVKGVTAKTKAGVDRTSTLTYSGEVDTSKIGTYTITYTAKKVDGTKVKKSITVSVGDYKKPTLSGVKNETIYTSDFATGETVDLLKGVTAKATDGKDLTKRIKVSGTVDVTTAGTYKVTYSVSNDSKVKTTKTVTYTVKAPVEILFESKTKNFVLLRKKENMTESEKVEQAKTAVLNKVTGYIRGKAQSDSKLSVTVKKQKVNYYLVTLTLKDENGYQAKEQCTVRLK